MGAPTQSGAVGKRPAPWFQRRPTGRGIQPVAWQGWALVIGYLALLFGAVLSMPRPDAMDPIAFAVPLVALLAVMGIVTIVFVLLVRRRTATEE